MKFLKKIFDHEYKQLEKFRKIADQVIALEEEYSKLSDKKLQAKTEEFKKRLENGETLEDIKVEAFATAREAAFRVIGERAYYVQILGGLAIHYGNIAEMKTGEGKTLTATMPAYLNALTGEGVHIITVNEYLAGRDAEWMGEVYRFLGLTVGVNYRELTPSEKKEAYNCDILYTTNNEVGFDYLRDNMVIKASDRVARPFNFVIIDEVDSVLIDEARTPLIISGGHMQSANLYMQTDKFVKGLKENDGYIYDEQTKATILDQKGIEKAEKAFKIKNLYASDELELLNSGCSVIYVVKDKTIIGLIGVNDLINPTATQTIKELKNFGLEVIMLTGDGEQVAKQIESDLGINNVIAGVLPKQKSEVIKNLKKQGKKVLMCGDGINDSPALSIADIGVSVSGGSDIAINSADVVLLNNNLSKISELISLSKRTIKNIKQNLFWAFIYNLCMFSALNFTINPMLAGIAMVLSSLTVILNALTLKIKRRIK